MIRILTAIRRSFAMVAFILVAATPAGAVTLHQGDLVAIDTHFGSMYTRIVRLVPGSTVVDQIAIRGLLENAGASDIAVLPNGRILVATYALGIVAVEPGDGAQSIYRSEEALGGHARALTLGSNGELLILVDAGGEGRILRDDPETGIEVLAAGSDLSGAADLARSPGGELFVAIPGAQSSGGFGSIVRLSSQGARLAVYTSDVFRGPSQLAVTGNGRVYASNRGIMAAGYGGGVTRTEVATGNTAGAVAANACEGVAVVSPELVFYSTKTTDMVGEHWSVRRMFPVGWGVGDVTGPMVSVTEEPVPAHSASWGAVKRTYR
jgi:hypothetical protein